MKQSQFTIYLIYCVNLRSIIYVGQTSRPLQDRLREHRCHTEEIRNVIQQYGHDSILIVPIEVVYDQDEAWARESFWTLYYIDKEEPLLNKGVGNCSKYFTPVEVMRTNYDRTLKPWIEEHGSYWKGKHLPDYMIERMRQYKLGSKNSPETREKISKALKAKYAVEPHHMLGKHLSKETREKISKANKGKEILPETREKISKALTGIKRGSLSKERKAFLQTVKAIPVKCIETGIVYFSASEAARQLNLNPTHICSCCKGERYTHGNLHWEYA